MDKFWKFFSKYKKPKKTFRQVLDGIYKEVDLIAPDEIRFDHSKWTYQFNRTIKVKRTRVEDVPEENRIRIYLMQDNSKYAILSLEYNDDKKFDMLTSSIEEVRFGDKGFIGQLDLNLITISQLWYDLFWDDLREYILKNDLIARVI